MRSCSLVGYSSLPMLFHHRLILSTANSAVSWSMPSTPKSPVMHQIIDAIGNSFPISNREVIIHIDGRVLSLGLPFLPIVLEISHQLFLLTIDGNHWIPLCFKSFPSAIDLLKLGVSVCMRCSLDRLLVGFEGKPKVFYHAADGRLTNRMSLAAERFRRACSSTWSSI